MRVAATDDDLGGDEAVFCVGEIEADGKEGGHSGGRVVAGPAGQGGELADDLVGVEVYEDGAIVGEDEDVAVGGEVDERVEVVLVQIGGFVKH